MQYFGGGELFNFELLQSLPRIFRNRVHQLFFVAASRHLNVNAAASLALKPAFDNGLVCYRVLKQQERGYGGAGVVELFDEAGYNLTWLFVTRALQGEAFPPGQSVMADEEDLNAGEVSFLGKGDNVLFPSYRGGDSLPLNHFTHRLNLVAV
ncbi:hypothetical protein ES703_71348 [subsurface metagenome]